MESTNTETQKNSSEVKLNINKKFQTDREQWTKTIEKYSKKLMNIKDIPELQVELYSSRQVVVDEMGKLQNLYTKKITELKKKRFEIFDEASNKKNVRLISQEKNIIMEGKMADSSLLTNVIEIQIEFYRETLKTIDSVIYGIKNRIELEQYRVG